MNGKKKKKIGLELDFFFFFWLGHELGPISKRGPRGPWGPAGAGLGSGKKPGTLNGAGPGHGSCPAGRVRVWKNPARIRPVAIPRVNAVWDLNSPHLFSTCNVGVTVSEPAFMGFDTPISVTSIMVPGLPFRLPWPCTASG